MNHTEQQFFNSQLSRGVKGELVASMALEQRGWEVVDVRSSDNYRAQDVDYRIHKGDLHLSVEVKTDKYITSTNNFLVEHLCSANKRQDGLGWFHYTTADSLIFVCEHSHAIYAFRMEDIRNYLEGGGKYEVRTSSFPGQTVENWLINMDHYTQQGYEIQIL